MMTTEGKNPSVIARLMGFDEIPSKHHPISTQQRVLSENYLKKSASLDSRVRRSRKTRQKNREILKKPNSTIDDSSENVSLRHMQLLKSTVIDSQNSFEEINDSHTTFGWEYKKELLERSKRTKVCQETWFSRRVCDLESKQVVISSNEGWKDKSITKVPIFKHVNMLTHPNIKFKKMSKGDLRLSSGRGNKNMSTNSEKVEFSNGSEGINKMFEKVDCNDSAKICFPCSSDDSFEQETTFTSLHCIEIDDELPKNTGEAYQPSPNSVLEPDNSSSSESGDNISTDLHGLWMKLQILKSESEENKSKPEIVTSSDGDTIERFFGPKESQDFSYLVNVLNEFGFHGSNFEVSHTQEHMVINPSIFETLEKKYAKQESWKKLDRRLLFDRINIGLSEILRPRDTVCSKLLRTKFSTMLRREVMEEELWNLLVSQEKEVNVDLSEKAVGKEAWLDLGEEVTRKRRRVGTSDGRSPLDHVGFPHDLSRSLFQDDVSVCAPPFDLNIAANSSATQNHSFSEGDSSFTRELEQTVEIGNQIGFNLSVDFPAVQDILRGAGGKNTSK